MFRKMPFILLLVVIIISLLNPFLSLEMKELLYTVSLSIKSLIVFALPLIIFCLLFKTAAELAHNATKMILFILAAICCSNFISTSLSHYVGIFVYHLDMTISIPQNRQDLVPLWELHLPKLIANNKAMFAGIILGLFFSIFKPQLAAKVALKLDKFMTQLLGIITILVPLFVAGFVVKLNFDGNLSLILRNYALVFAVILLAQYSYITLIYLVVRSGKWKVFVESIKNMLPATIAGFSTMSSAAAMPLTLLGTEKNTKNSDIAKASIPVTVNVHLIGDCFAIPILAFAVMKSYGVPEPLFISYLIFTFYFVIAKFSVAAVPGGGVLVMLPILENYLGFNAEMLSLITALYILFDPVITSANVLGNGGFAMVIDRMQKALMRKFSVRNYESI